MTQPESGWQLVQLPPNTRARERHNVTRFTGAFLVTTCLLTKPERVEHRGFPYMLLVVYSDNPNINGVGASPATYDCSATNDRNASDIHMRKPYMGRPPRLPVFSTLADIDQPHFVAATPSTGLIPWC